MAMACSAKVLAIALIISSAFEACLGSSRSDRVWPLSNSSSIDLGQSSPFGPRLKASENYRYDFHRGVDIPTPLGTKLYAIDNGKVRIAGSHDKFSDGVIQIEHIGWDENPSIKYYSTYLHIDSAPNRVLVSKNDIVTKGQHIGYSWKSASGFPHLHFEIRVGGLFQRHCCNPWKFLPGPNTFAADVSLALDSNTCKAYVSVAVAPDQLTFNRIELHINHGQMTEEFNYDMCEDNLVHSFSEMDDPNFENFLVISPKKFSSSSYANNEDAEYSFEFYGLSAPNGATVFAKALDVFGNSVTTAVMQLTC